MKKESWGDLEDNLHSFADRTFPDMDYKAREQLSHFLSLIDEPTVALAVHQWHPSNLNEAVMHTPEAEAIK